MAERAKFLGHETKRKLPNYRTCPASIRIYAAKSSILCPNSTDRGRPATPVCEVVRFSRISRDWALAERLAGGIRSTGFLYEIGFLLRRLAAFLRRFAKKPRRSSRFLRSFSPFLRRLRAKLRSFLFLLRRFEVNP